MNNSNCSLFNATKEVLANFSRSALLAGVVIIAGALTGTEAKAVSIISSFNTGGQEIAVALDPNSGNLYTYQSFSGNIIERSTLGVQLGTIARPGNSSNDFGLDFGPAGLIAFNGDDSPETATFYDNTNMVTSTLNLPSSGMVGGTFNSNTGTLFTVDFIGSDLIREINATTGAEINNFTPGAGFDVFFGGINAIGNGNLLLVSSSQNVIRELTSSGTFVQDTDLSSLFGISLLSGGMSGISAINSQLAWITTTGGDVALVDLSTSVVPLPAALPLYGTGLAIMGFFAWHRKRKVISVA